MGLPRWAIQVLGMGEARVVGAGSNPEGSDSARRIGIVATDLVGQLKGLLDNPDFVAQAKGLIPEGVDISKLLEDPSKLLDLLKQSPDLLNKFQEFLPGVDIEGGLGQLAGLAAGAAGAAGAAAGAAGDAAGAAAGAASDAAGAAAGAAGDAAGAAAGAAEGAADAATEAGGSILEKVKDIFK